MRFKLNLFTVCILREHQECKVSQEHQATQDYPAETESVELKEKEGNQDHLYVFEWVYEILYLLQTKSAVSDGRVHMRYLSITITANTQRLRTLDEGSVQDVAFSPLYSCAIMINEWIHVYKILNFMNVFTMSTKSLWDDS